MAADPARPKLTKEKALTSSVTPYVKSQDAWRSERDLLNRSRFELTQRAVAGVPDALRVAGTPLLAQPGWIPEAPVPLDAVRLEWAGEATPAPITGREASLQGSLPLAEDGAPFGRYADAVEALARPRLFENRQCYRLLDVDAEPDGSPRLRFGRGSYFDVINICEAAAHEFAAAATAAGPGSVPAARTPFRAEIGDPTDLARRPVMAAISTLTIRHDAGAGTASFVLHWRDPAKVATGGGLYQVMPVGMFQPSADAPWNETNDFDLWRSTARELSEELLGSTEDYGSEVSAIDYDGWPFYAALQDARRAGTARVFWLGLGVDALTFVCDMLTVVVLEAATFDELFPKMASTNDEGHRVVDAEDATGRSVGIPFRADHVERLTEREHMQPAGAALLRLAWQHRDILLP
ncbi:XRE family transcriptional regulator [Streptomyces sp. NPDC001584]|uniref:XRE family transcriptional regulator n=1 Tax=Streptomyces sp. NPDC001584 TaxID=3154521 RepID=UPI0033236299